MDKFGRRKDASKPRALTRNAGCQSGNHGGGVDEHGHSFEHQFSGHWPREVWQDVPILMAVSGGVDSVALLRAICSLKPAHASGVTVAHFNHRWRGADSDADADFVVELSRQMGIPCEVGTADANLAHCVGGLEERGRRARYAFLQETAERLGARYVATAHTADDQAETILHHILRGTGPRGLAGMRRVRPLGPAVTLVRPLLTVRRATLAEYLNDMGQPFREDTTNSDLRFRRARIRHELLPLLSRQYNADVVGALLRLGRLTAETRGAIEQLASTLGERVVTRQDDRQIELMAVPLATEPRYLVREVLISLWRTARWPLKSMGYREWEALADIVARCARAEPVRPQVFPGNVTVTAEAGRVRLVRDA